jgi:hypothetical protein
MDARQSIPFQLTANLIEILGATTQLPSPVGSFTPTVHGMVSSGTNGSLVSTPSVAKVIKGVCDLRIVLLVTGINSFAQLVYSKLKERASASGAVAIKVFSPGTKCTPNDGHSAFISELVDFRTDVIVCPFLTAKIPSEIYSKVSDCFLKLER